MGKGFGYVNFEAKDAVVLALEKSGQVFNEREIRVQPYQYKQTTGKKKDKKTKMGKNKKGNDKSPRKQGKTPTDGNKPEFSKVAQGKKRKGPPAGEDVQQKEFKGEVANKKFKVAKKSVKSKIKSKVVNKQKKKIAEIFSK